MVALLLLAACGDEGASTVVDDLPAGSATPGSTASLIERPPTTSGASRLDPPVVAWRSGAQRDLDSLVAGTLLYEGNCLLLLAPEATTPRPIIWPSGTTWDHELEQVVMADGTALHVGSLIEGGGGGGSFDVEDPDLPTDIADGRWVGLQRCGALHGSGKYVRFDAAGSVHLAEN